MALEPRIITLNRLPSGFNHRHDLFALYRLTLHRCIDQAFGWDEDFQRQRFMTAYVGKDCYAIAVDEVDVGCIVLTYQTDNVHLSLLLVQPEHQRQGIGRQVMKTLMLQSADTGQVVTLSCLAGNQNAMEFYRALGFEIVGREEHFVNLRYAANRLGKDLSSDPLIAFSEHLQTAAGVDDPNATFGVLTTLDSQGAPASRMVTLRQVTAQSLTLNINALSPKAEHLRANGHWELLCFLPSLKVQYRFRGEASFFSDLALQREWQAKPRNSRLADIYHATVRQQSSILPDRHTLLDEIAMLSQDTAIHCKPDSVVNLLLSPTWIEQWVGSPKDRLHHRRVYCWDQVLWRLQTLVP